MRSGKDFWNAMCCVWIRLGTKSSHKFSHMNIYWELTIKHLGDISDLENVLSIINHKLFASNHATNLSTPGEGKHSRNVTNFV